MRLFLDMVILTWAEKVIGLQSMWAPSVVSLTQKTLGTVKLTQCLVGEHMDNGNWEKGLSPPRQTSPPRLWSRTKVQGRNVCTAMPEVVETQQRKAGVSMQARHSKINQRLAYEQLVSFGLLKTIANMRTGISIKSIGPLKALKLLLQETPWANS